MPPKFKSLTITHVILTAIFLFNGFVNNFLQILNWFLVRPFSKRWAWKINYYLLTSVNYSAIFFLEWWVNVNIVLHMDETDKKNAKNEHGLFIVNHKYEVDWLFIGWLSYQIGSLASNRPVCKNALKFLPVGGLLYLLSDSIFLSKNFKEDIKQIENKANLWSQYPYPLHVYLYPEGTRFTTAKSIISKQYAIKNGLPEFKHHLRIHSRGFQAILNSMKNILGAVYDVTVVFEENNKLEPTFFNFLSGNPSTVHIFVRRYPLEEIPFTNQDKFLWDLFQKKDDLVDKFLRTGKFDIPVNGNRINSWKPLLSEIVWGGILCVVFYGLWLQIFGWNPEFLLYFVVCGVGIVYLLMKISINFSKATPTGT